MLAELRERDATGEIAAIYAEIRRLWAVPYVSSLQRHLATRPGWLPWTWAALGPAFASGTAQAAAWRAAEGLGVPPLAPISRRVTWLLKVRVGRLRSAPYRRPSGGSHATVPMSAGTLTSRISSVSEVAISLCRRPPGI